MVGGSGNGLDSTLGGLVWVRRKNGSWWPGQIVKEEELCEADLATPRSGTPIKLLARDDASVDWFDLETTPAVKAFRCGEYDTCIEKAKAVAANNKLKFTKYPRRENAIVCALEIENACILKDSLDNGTGQNSHSSEETSSEEPVYAWEENSNLTQELSHSGISYEESNGFAHVKTLPCRDKMRTTLNDSEDDVDEGIKRMKGLNDLGLGIESKKKDTILGLTNLSPQGTVFVNNHCGVNGMTKGNLTNGSSTSSLKRKRSQVVHINELLKREYRPRPVTKVLENTTMVPVRIICDEFANPFERYDVVSSSCECEDSAKSSYAELSNGLFPEDDSSDILVDVPYVDREEQPSGLSPAHQSSFPTNRYVGAFRGDSSRNIQVPASSCGHESLDQLLAEHMNQKVEKSASKWQSKGKRNARHLIKGEEQYSSWKTDVHDRIDPYMMAGHENALRFPSISNGLVNGLHYHKSRFSLQSNLELVDVSSRHSHTDSLLYEVEVTVEATRSQVQHVPYISLMSKVNGKPVTGHPVPVEALEDGFCDPKSADCPEETEMEVIVKPKSHKRKKTKHWSRSHRSKSKKRRGSSSKKTRKLSSLSGAQKQSLVKSKTMSQTSNGPTLACIPIKVVFSRINEALNCSRSTHLTSNT